MQIQTTRLISALKQLGTIGFEEGHGTSRIAYSTAFFAGRDYVEALMRNAGLKTRIDPVGNLIGSLPGRDTRRIAIGSHVDTVPGGGIYDGAYGILSGIEVLHTLIENTYSNHYTLEVIAFNEEEGNAVGGTFGSKAFAGAAQEASAIERCSTFGLSREDIDACRQDPADYRAYLEWHIEQGGILDTEHISLGVVEGIVAIARYLITVKGQANHAGSTPMNLRDDALEKACSVIQAAYTVSRETDPGMTCTIGSVNVKPGAVNVIPGEVDFPLELRAMNPDSIRSVVNALERRFPGGDVSICQFLWQDETRMDTTLMDCIEHCCRRQGFSYRRMPSGAGHDAINMARFTPTAMLFIPSVGGISHSIEENSLDEDVENGAKVLLDVILELDRRRDE